MLNLFRERDSKANPNNNNEKQQKVKYVSIIQAFKISAFAHDLQLKQCSCLMNIYW